MMTLEATDKQREDEMSERTTRYQGFWFEIGDEYLSRDERWVAPVTVRDENYVLLAVLPATEDAEQTARGYVDRGTAALEIARQGRVAAQVSRAWDLTQKSESADTLEYEEQ